MKIIQFIDSPSYEKATSPRAIIFFLILITSVSMGMCYMQKLARKNLFKKKQSHEMLKIQAGKVTEMQKNLNLLREENIQLQEKMQRVQEKDRGKQLPTEIIKQISTILPRELYLQKIDFDQVIIVKGKGKKKHQHKVQQFVACCLNESWCPHAELEITLENNEIFSFTITINKNAQRASNGRY